MAVHLPVGMTSLRLALAAAALPLLTACSAVVPIEVTRVVSLESPGGPFASAQPIDLSQEPAVWSRRDSVDAVSIDEVTATVLSVGSGHQPASVTLSVAFRPDGAPADGSQDLQAGTLSALALTPGATARLAGSAPLDDFLLQVLQGSGRFTAIAAGSLDGPASAVLEVSLRGSASYRLAGR